MDVFSNPLSLIIYSLAVNQAVEIWHHSALLAYPRMMIELYSDFEHIQGIRRKAIELLMCPWCLSVWIALAVLLLTFSQFTQTLVWVLAVSRLANYLADAEKRLRPKA